jgi:hypothetical protein
MTTNEKVLYRLSASVVGLDVGRAVGFGDGIVVGRAVGFRKLGSAVGIKTARSSSSSLVDPILLLLLLVVELLSLPELSLFREEK